MHPNKPMNRNGNAIREPGWEHVPEYPKGFVVVRVIQQAFALALVIASAYTLSVESNPPGGIMLATSLCSLLVSSWEYVAQTFMPQYFNYWAVLILDILLFVFFLIAFAINAAVAVATYFFKYGYRDVFSAISTFGALSAVLFFIAFIIDSVVISRHRRAGLSATPGDIIIGRDSMSPEPRDYDSMSRGSTMPPMSQYGAPTRGSTMPPMSQYGAPARGSAMQPTSQYGAPTRGSMPPPPPQAASAMRDSTVSSLRSSMQNSVRSSQASTFYSPHSSYMSGHKHDSKYSSGGFASQDGLYAPPSQQQQNHYSYTGNTMSHV